MPEMHLKQPVFITYSASQSFTKYEEGIQKFEKTGDCRYIHRYNLHKTCFQPDMAYKELAIMG